MAWVSKFSGLPTLTDIPDAADSYGSGVFTIDTLASANIRDWGNAGNRFAPRAYVSLSTISASISSVLRVTGRCSAFGIVNEFNSRRGVALYGPADDDACLAFIEEPAPAPSPSPGLGYGRAVENGTFTESGGPSPITDCAVPNQLRIYWNGTGSAFVIPDAGFGSWSVAANTVSYWYSEDDGTTWSRVGDRAIAGGVAPTRAAIWAGIDAAFGETLTHTFTTLEVMEDAAPVGGSPPVIDNEDPPEGAPNVDANANLSIDVTDPDADLDASSVEIAVNGTTAWTGDAQQSGFAVTKTPITNGFNYLINPDAALPLGTNTLFVRAADTGGPNEATRTILFTVGPAPVVGRGGFEDLGQIDSSGGPPDHRRHDGLGAGQLVPGPQTQSVGSTGPFPAAGFSDKQQLDDVLPGAGGPAHHNYPDGLTVGQRVGGSATISTEDDDHFTKQGAFEDHGEVELVDVVGVGLDDLDNKDGANFVDEVEHLLGAPPEFNPHTPTTDGEGHVHLEYDRVYRAFIYDTDPGRNPGEAWAEPTLNNFTGYARDGTHYTNGVQDVGPVQAPWSAEVASVDRSSRSSFPTRSLIVITEFEIVLYDLDNWPTNLDVWARFRFGDNGAGGYKLFARGTNTGQRIWAKNGVLYYANQQTPWEVGRLHIFDLKRDGAQEAAQLIGSDNHWKAQAGLDFTDRNASTFWTTTGVSPSLRISNEYNYEMAVHQDPSDPLRVWVALAGEDNFDVIELYDNVPQKDYNGTPTPTANVGDVRACTFDAAGVLWLGQYDKIWRNGLDYQGGVIVNPNEPNAGGDLNGQVNPGRYPVATLPDGLTVKQLVATQNWIFAATERGVYAVHKTSLEVRLAYSITGDGGIGVSTSSAGGEAIPGDREIVEPALFIWNAQKSSYLMIATYDRGGTVVVRLRDDQVIQSREHPVLQEPGAFFAAGWVE